MKNPTLIELKILHPIYPLSPFYYDFPNNFYIKKEFTTLVITKRTVIFEASGIMVEA